MGLRIASCAHAVPDAVETSADVAKKVSKTAAWVEQHTGVLRRHVAPDGVSVVDLAAEAGRRALSDSGPPDLILYASASQHQAIPDTSVFLQKAMGLTGIACYSVHATCMSFMVSLQLADSLLATRAYRRILICSAELASRARNWQQPESAALLGDGAAAVMIEWEDSPAGLKAFAMTTWPEGSEFTEVRGGGLRKPPNGPDTNPDDHVFHMHGRAAYKSTRPRLVQVIKQVCEDSGWSLGDIDLVVPHQASGPGLKLLERLGFERRQVLNILADYGNCVAASIPMALSVAVEQNRVNRGDRVLILGAGAGLTVGAALLQW